LLAESVAASAATTAGPREFAMKPVPGQPGRYEGALTAPAPGAVRLQISLGGGVALEDQIVVRDSRLELDDLRLNRPLLERLASASGGRAFEWNRLHELNAALPRNPEVTVLSGTPRPLWDRAATIWAFVGFLGLEWLVRKIRRLA
jgi:hypothetical protein